ncbi:1-deoxy-D-xylulose-5-phosphate synthase [Actinocrinis sp.]|jgi:1-deoxy-D-xylulose-5-phosphate synthase|uniref:1-deoxy-D-xylulose-5-phosphate synthase n=1 Tax=Actinocrinis sp. TaxID=1920516 RepID=UPI0032C21A1C
MEAFPVTTTHVPGSRRAESPSPATAWPLIADLAAPGALSAMSDAQLAGLAAEIRGFLVEKVCATGGHLGVNLGVVELTIALHRVFDSPRDVLLFDTGHQTYVHKLLTGRAAGFETLRQAGGLSGYPSPAESPHDWIESSHASTALSYADGMAKAFALRGEHGRRVVAVIGDGAMTGGMALEGLNNLSGADRPVIVVLNDNGRSYDPTIGGLARHFEALRGRPAWRPDTTADPADDSVFEQLGLAYLGPVDGHDRIAVEAALRRASSLARPVVVHCVTVKGRGYQPAEDDEADRMHSIGVLDPVTGRQKAPGGTSWTAVFGAELARIGAERPEVAAVTAAMLQPTGLKAFAAAFPDRVFDVGIAEQHAVCSAAGLAAAGLHPVVCLYATFLNRAFDQVLMDVALRGLPVTLVLDRAGITGPDGASHHGMWDTPILAAVPGVRIAAPRDPARLCELLREAVAADGPTVVRLPKASVGPDIEAVTRMDGVDILHRSSRMGLDVLFVTAGALAESSLEAARRLEADGVGVTVADPRWIVPANPFLIGLAARHRLVVTVEDGSATGGMGSLVQAACAEAGVPTPVRILGLPRAFVAHGERADLLAAAGLDGAGIAEAARRPVNGMTLRSTNPPTVVRGRGALWLPRLSVLRRR